MSKREDHESHRLELLRVITGLIESGGIDGNLHGPTRGTGCVLCEFIAEAHEEIDHSAAEGLK